MIMNDNKVKYLLGIDGGGTKTEFLLCNSDGTEIRRLFLGGSNPVNKGVENTFAVLGEGIAQICDGFDFSQVSVFAGIAGAKSGENQRLINEFLSRFGFASFGCGSDIDLALEAAISLPQTIQQTARRLTTSRFPKCPVASTNL